MLYIWNRSPINQAKCSGTLQQTKPDQSSHMDKIATAVDLSQNDEIDETPAVAETVRWCIFQRGLLFCGSKSNSRVTEKGDREIEAFVFMQYTTGENSVFSKVLTLVSCKTWINSRMIWQAIL
jgi:hypothetical protein